MRRVSVPYFRPDLWRPEIDEVVAALRSGLADDRAAGEAVRGGVSRRRGRPARRRGQLCTAALHLAVEALGLKAGTGRAGADDDLRRDGRGRALPRRRAAARRLRSRDAEHRPRGRGAKARRISGRAASRRSSRGTPGRRDHPGPRRRADARHGRVVRRGRRPHGLWVVEDAAHAFPAACRPVDARRVAALRREHVGRDLLLLLREQDDHDGRGRDGRHRRRGAGRPHAADVAARSVARRLGTLLGRRKLGLPDRRPGLQVQPDRHRGRDRDPPARAGREDAPREGRGGPPVTARRWPRSRSWSCRPTRRTASTPGTSSRSGCGSIGSRSTGTRSWRS